MHESDYTATINRKLRGRLRRVWKIKADMQGGVEDCYYLGERDLWVEYKLIKTLPKRDSTRVVPELSELQKGWLLDHYATHGNAMVIVGVQDAPGFRGCASIPFYSPEEWLNGVRRDIAHHRLLTYTGVAELIAARCTL